jgi:hypothetical protein
MGKKKQASHTVMLLSGIAIGIVSSMIAQYLYERYFRPSP